MTALDFRWTILCVIAWYFLRNSLSLWVDSRESERCNGTILDSSAKIRSERFYHPTVFVRKVFREKKKKTHNLKMTKNVAKNILNSKKVKTNNFQTLCITDVRLKNCKFMQSESQSHFSNFSKVFFLICLFSHMNRSLSFSHTTTWNICRRREEYVVMLHLPMSFGFYSIFIELKKDFFLPPLLTYHRVLDWMLERVFL